MVCAGGSYKQKVAGWMARTLSPWRAGSRAASSPGYRKVFRTPGRSPRPAPKLTPLAGNEWPDSCALRAPLFDLPLADEQCSEQTNASLELSANKMHSVIDNQSSV